MKNQLSHHVQSNFVHHLPVGGPARLHVGQCDLRVMSRVLELPVPVQHHGAAQHHCGPEMRKAIHN